MKKLIAVLIAIAVCCACVLPVAAEEFVPSISYKDHPDIVGDPEIKDDAQEDVDNVTLIVTPVADALDVPEGDRDEAETTLIDVYEQLKDGDMKLPVPDAEDDDKYYVVRDLFDISVVDDEGNDVDVSTVKVTFDLGLKEGAEVVVMVYDGEWKIVDGVVYNNNGSVTVVFDTLGPVAFCIENEGSSTTGDKMAQELGIWVTMMAVSACAIIVLIATRRRERNEA